VLQPVGPGQSYVKEITGVNMTDRELSDLYVDMGKRFVVNEFEEPELLHTTKPLHLDARQEEEASAMNAAMVQAFRTANDALPDSVAVIRMYQAAREREAARLRVGPGAVGA
jgi:hypothetical protein